SRLLARLGGRTGGIALHHVALLAEAAPAAEPTGVGIFGSKQHGAEQRDEQHGEESFHRRSPGKDRHAARKIFRCASIGSGAVATPSNRTRRRIFWCVLCGIKRRVS